MAAVLPPSTALDAAARGRLDALIALLRAATDELEAIALVLEEPRHEHYVRRRIVEAHAILDRLLSVGPDGQVSGAWAAWAREHIPATYEMGAGLAVRDLRAQMLAPVTGDAAIHLRAVESLLGRYLLDTTEIVVQLKLASVRATRVLLAQAGFGEQIAAGILGGLPRRETSRLLAAAMRRAVFGALPPGAEWTPASLTHVEIGGRNYRLDTWAEMHARTETARASTAGTRGMCATNGVLHVQITTHAHPPCICTPFEGRIYRIYEDRGDPRFPWIGTVPGGGCPMHPNCVHREAPAVVGYLEERGDVEGRTEVPRDFRGKSTSELARLVRQHRDELAPYSTRPRGMLPQDFRLRKAVAA